MNVVEKEKELSNYYWCPIIKFLVFSFKRYLLLAVKSSFHIDWDLFQIMSIRRFKLSVKFVMRLLMTYQKDLCSNIRKCLCLLFPQGNCYL